jgi:hypothetical protein
MEKVKKLIEDLKCAIIIYEKYPCEAYLSDCLSLAKQIKQSLECLK